MGETMDGLRLYVTSLLVLASCQDANAQPGDDKLVKDATNDVLSKWPGVPPKIPKLGPKGTKDCKAFMAFKPNVVRDDLVKKRDALANALTRKEQQALKAYIIDEFPLQLAESSDPCATGPVVMPDEVLAGKRRADDFIAGMRSRASYAIVLDIESEPKAAKFSFAPKYGKDWTEVGTDVKGEKTWRGKYKYKIEKDGYRTITGERTLMDGERITVKCSLTKESPSSAETAAVVVVVPCSFTAR
jgi:hypothetical protein